MTSLPSINNFSLCALVKIWRFERFRTGVKYAAALLHSARSSSSSESNLHLLAPHDYNLPFGDTQLPLPPPTTPLQFLGQPYFLIRLVGRQHPFFSRCTSSFQLAESRAARHSSSTLYYQAGANDQSPAVDHARITDH